MNNDKLVKCFAEVLGLPIENITDDLAYNSAKEWDSIAHMALVAAIEREFNVILETEEILAMSTVAQARITLQKHGVNFYAA